MIGLFPMAIQASVDVMNRTIQFGAPTSAWWVQMATAIIFGLGFSTLLTLILVPVMLALPEQLRNSVSRQQIADLRGQLGRRS
jgi:multidrug efflux pump